MTDKPAVSRSLREVWGWKDAAYREVAHLPRREALSALLTSADKAAKAIGLDLPVLSPPRTRIVAEDRDGYRIDTLNE